MRKTCLPLWKVERFLFAGWQIALDASRGQQCVVGEAMSGKLFGHGQIHFKRFFAIGIEARALRQSVLADCRLKESLRRQAVFAALMYSQKLLAQIFPGLAPA